MTDLIEDNDQADKIARMAFDNGALAMRASLMKKFMEMDFFLSTMIVQHHPKPRMENGKPPEKGS